MNLNQIYCKSNEPSYLNFEISNNTYSVMDLEEKNYKSISSKTDFTKQSKTFLLIALSVGAIINSSQASLELEKKSFDDIFDSKVSSFIEQKIVLNSNSISDEKKWIDDLLIQAKDLKTHKDLFPYYSKINSLMIEKKFDSYNEILTKIETKELNETLIIALLRLSFVWKDEIHSWKQFLEQSSIVLEDRGHDSKKLLIGLI